MKFASSCAASVAFLIVSLALEASAHFQLTYPPDRGDNDATQTRSPCGGLDTPSEVRTPWGIHGGQLKFEAGHDEADTAVYLAVGNNPGANDFTIILADKFLQLGLGTFCWNDLAVPSLSSVSDGVNATIQVVQAGHTGGGLYNCADITFVNSPPTVEACSNSSGVTAQPGTSAAATATPTTTTGSNSTATSTDTASASATSNAAAPGNLAGCAYVVFAGAVAMAWLL